ncbi:MAG: SRPBCC family protein [Pseudomonadota bacterium]
MADYRFLTTWIVDAEVEPVWHAIHDVVRWPEWWPGVEAVEDLGGDRYRHTWRSVVPYPVRFDISVTCIEEPRLIDGVASGELAGSGRWRLWGDGPTVVTYEWDVRTTRPWMNLVAPVARPVFEWNHHAVMRRGGEGLARRLGTRLLARS